MDLTPETPWDSTPDVSARIVTAIGRIASVMRSGMWEFATAENLNPAQAEILYLLQGRSSGVRLSWLAGQLSISTASASDSVTALVAKGLVRKARADDDGRATALFLTADGVQLAARIGSAVSFADEAAAALPAPMQAEMLTGLLKMIAQLKYPGQPAPHHCALVNAPLPISFIRIDCAEHVPAEPAVQQRNWEVFA